MSIAFDLEILLFGICPKDIIRNIKTFLVAKNWKQCVVPNKRGIIK